MNSLVGYGSSDDEDDIQPEKPAKIAKTESNAPRNDAPPVEAPTIPTRAQQSLNTTAELQIAEPPRTDPGPSVAPAGPDVGPSIGEDGTPFSPYTYERQRRRELTMPTVPNFDIPDSPPPPPQNSEEAAVLAATTKKFERFLELKKQGMHFNERLQNSSSLRNPSLLQKLMDFADVSQEESYASSLPDDLAVPVKWPEECYIENLLRQNEQKEKKRQAKRDKVDFVPPSKSAGSSTTGTPASGKAEPRKSRFDVK